VTTDRSAGNWKKVDGQHGIYERVQDPLPLQNDAKTRKLRQLVENLKSTMDSVISQANQRPRR
jgi:hypothetical protein